MSAAMAHDAVWGEPQAMQQLVSDAPLAQNTSEELIERLAQTAIQRRRDEQLLGELGLADERRRDDALASLLGEA